MRKSNLLLVIATACLLTIPATAGTTVRPAAIPPAKPGAAKAKPPAVTPILLPEARPKQPYDTVLAVVLTVPYGRAQFSFDALPAWLIFDPTHFVFTGTPTEIANVSYKITLTVKNVDDTAAAPQTIVLTLPVTVGPQIAYQDPAKAPKPAAPIAPNGKPSVFKSGTIGVLTAEGKEPVPPGTDPATIAAQNVTAPPAIPVPKIYLDSQPVAGAKLSGHIDLATLAPTPTASVPADTTKGTPAKPGNLPSVRVDVADPENGTTRALLQITPGDNTKQADSIEVGPDGKFTLAFVNPLTFGQQITVIPEPPAQHTFVGPYVPPAPQPVGAALDIEKPATAVIPVVTSQPLTSPLTKPSLTAALVNNTNALAGIATPSTNIAVLRFKSETKLQSPLGCVTADGLEKDDNVRFELLTGTSGTVKTVASNSSGTFAITLTQPLLEGDKVQLVQVLAAHTQVPENQKSTCNSGLYTVAPEGDWGRIHADFTAGILLSNNNQIATADSGNFSQAHEFLALTVEWASQLPGCYLLSFKVKENPDSTNQCYDDKTNALKNYKPHDNWKPGLSGYFESRLTAIPVTTLSSKQTSSTSTASTANSPFGNPSDTSTTPSDTSTASILSSNQLGTAQTARLGVGIYAPFLLTRWEYHQQPNAFFIAPLVKIGFDTVTGASSVTVVPGTPGASLPTGTTSATITAESLYNYRGYGGRVGHFAMTRSERRAPETNSYFDLLFGPYSNLESLVCDRTIATPPASGSTIYGPVTGQKPPTNYSGSSCLTDYPNYYVGTPAGSTTSNPLVYAPLDIRKRLYRLDLEGLLKIPNTALYIGFNANIGQKTVGGSHLDHGYAAPDDLRFLFGTKFDISTFLSKVGIKPF